MTFPLPKAKWKCRLLSTAASLFISLSNPLNITLLTSQLLTARAVWGQPDGVNTCLQVLRCFHGAASSLAQQGSSARDREVRAVTGRKISGDEWIKAVIRGADGKSPRWRHLLPIGGILLGLQSRDHGGPVERGVEKSLVKAMNLALEENRDARGLPWHCITFVANYTFEVLSEADFAQIKHDV